MKKTRAGWLEGGHDSNKERKRQEAGLCRAARDSARRKASGCVLARVRKKESARLRKEAQRPLETAAERTGETRESGESEEKGGGPRRTRAA